jgi:PAS domain S-box-containing protein
MDLDQTTRNRRAAEGELVPEAEFEVQHAIRDKPVRSALDESELRHREILEALPIAVYTTDAKGRITYFNRAAAELSGRTPRVGTDLWCVTWRLFRPDGSPLPHDQCPMAVALKENRPVTGEVIVAERPDGTRASVIPYPVPLRDATGALIGGVNTLVDITERKQVLDALRESEARLATELADAKELQQISAKLIHEDDTETLYTEILDAAVRIMRSDMGSMQKFHPDRNELELLASKGFTPEAVEFWNWVRVGGASTCSMALKTGSRCIAPNVDQCDFMAGTTDLEVYRQAQIRSVQSTPLVSRSGRAIGMISTHWRQPHEPSERELRLLDVLARQAADLIERKSAEAALRESDERQRLLINELNHRVKNTLAVVQALAQQSFGGSDVPEDARSAFDGRLEALASAHDVLTREQWKSVDLKDIVRGALKACGVSDRASVKGPSVQFGPRVAVTLAMTLHELCTNAIKYGALSVEDGRVSIAWAISGEDEPRLRFRWKERRGPRVSEPRRRGFGSRLIERALATDLKGKARLEYPSDGVLFEFDAPLPSHNSDEAEFEDDRG